MKFILLILLPLSICAYGFLPVSFSFDKDELKNPNTLLISHQECGCPCAEAFITGGEMIIPESILRKNPNIGRQEISLTGREPYEPYDFNIARQPIIITGEVVGVDTIYCDASGQEVAPLFKVDSWAVESYYPRLWTHGKAFMIIFLISCLLLVCALVSLTWVVIQRSLKPKAANTALPK